MEPESWVVDLEAGEGVGSGYGVAETYEWRN